MNNYLVIIFLLFALTNTQTTADVSALHNNNQNDNLNPLNDPNQDTSHNEQDKRTICSVLNSLSCSGSKPQSIYYKTRPAASYVSSTRPIVGYRYTRPKIPFAIKAPVAIKPTYGKWKPITVKPTVVPILRPTDTVQSIPVQSLPSSPQSHFIQTIPVSSLIGQHAHIHPLNHVHVAQGNQFATLPHGHYSPFNQLIPLKTPSATVPIAKPIYPAPVIFEVTKPNLGVLPLGAKFNTHVLNEVPQHFHLKPTVPVVPALPPPPPVAVPTANRPFAAIQPNGVYATSSILPAVQQPVQGIIQTPVGFPSIVAQPGVSVEYHGTQNYLPFAKPNVDYNNAVHPHLHLPYQHDAHGFGLQQQQQQQQQQLLPHDHYHHHLEQQQQQQYVSQSENPASAYIQAVPQQYQHEIPQERLPLEGEQQYVDEQQGYTQGLPSVNIHGDYEQSNGVIQPGQTDVPFPYHLPNHPTWQASLAAYQTQQIDGVQDDATNFNDPSAFRPSPELEPPYVKK